DEKIVARVALADEAEALEETAAALVLRAVVRHDAVEPQLAEDPRDRRAQPLEHVAAALVRAIDGVAEDACPERPAHDLREIEPADDGAVAGGAIEHQETC